MTEYETAADIEIRDKLAALEEAIDIAVTQPAFMDAFHKTPYAKTGGRSFKQLVFDTLFETCVEATYDLDHSALPLDAFAEILQVRQAEDRISVGRAYQYIRDQRIKMDGLSYSPTLSFVKIFGTDQQKEVMDVMLRWKAAAIAFASAVNSQTYPSVSGRMYAHLEKMTRIFDDALHPYLNSLKDNPSQTKKDAPYNSLELNDIYTRAEDLALPQDAMTRIKSDLKRMDGMMPTSVDYNGAMHTVMTILKLPYHSRSDLACDVAGAEQLMNREHFGQDEVKRRIVEEVAVHMRRGKSNGTILCLDGPPGVGKTALAEIVADVLGRKLVKLSLGGVRDSAEIRGHRSTYANALPGRIIRGLLDCGVKNPIFLLDEIDKVGTGNGNNPDVEAALLEVTDPQQNTHFRDSFLDIDFDLSEVMFIATSNDKRNIMPALLDRMEVINLPAYKMEEKLVIAKKFLLPRQMEMCGLLAKDINISPQAMASIVHNYVREAGVRELERLIGKLCRKVVYQLSRGGDSCIRITCDNLAEFIGQPLHSRRRLTEQPSIGLVNGLGVSNHIGSVLPIEAISYPASGGFAIKATGQLGDTMKDSIEVVTSWIRANIDDLGMKKKALDKINLHIDAPSGDKKNGPSAGAAFVTACVSVLINRPVPADIAMTGQMSLSGRVLAIGATIAKLEGAMRDGIKTVYIPAENAADMNKFPAEIRATLRIVPVSHIHDVLEDIFPDVFRRSVHNIQTATEDDQRQVDQSADMPAWLPAPGCV